MEFFIKKNATLPVLKLQVVKDGRSDYNSFMKTIEESAIFFSMVDVDTGIPKISSRPAGFVEKILLDPNASPEYYIYYQFTNKDTNRIGRYEGQFMLRNDDGVLIVPIRESLFINVQESFIADDLEYSSCYVSEFPCCLPYATTTTTNPPITSTTTTEPPVTTSTTTITPPPTTSTTTITPPITTTTTTLSGVTSWTITQGVGDIDFYCDVDLILWSVLWSENMNELVPGTRLYTTSDLVGDPIYLNEQSYYTVFEKDGTPIDNRFSINPTGGLAWEDAPRYVGNVYHCGDPIPCRELSFTRNTNENTTINYYNCGGTYASQIISLGQTINVCGSFPVYKLGIDVTIGNNC